MIIGACRLVCKIFDHSPVCRIGGDEFAAILQGRDYENREALFRQFREQIELNRKANKVIVSGGASQFRPGEDDSFDPVFRRVDAEMYQQKQAWKQQHLPLPAGQD